MLGERSGAEHRPGGSTMSTTRNNTYAGAALAVGLAAMLGPACGQDGGSVMIDVADCIKLEAPEARLACYESRIAAYFGQPAAAQAAASRPPAPAPTIAAAVRQPEPAPTRSAAVASTPAVAQPAASDGNEHSRRATKARTEAAGPPNEIVSRVKELRQIVPNTYEITLENGQVWRQAQSKQYTLRIGQQVRIYGTRWGAASRLSSNESKAFIQVDRVR